MTTRLTWAISYWGSLGTKPLFVRVSEMSNGECDAMVDMTLNDLLTNIKVIHLVPVDSSCTTFYRLTIVTFAVACTVLKQ